MKGVSENMKVNINYVLNELQKAVESKNKGNDVNDTDKSDKRIRQWNDVLSGILAGNLKIGTRKPTEYPIWVTPEIVKGGFATGRALAATSSLSLDEHAAILKFNTISYRESLFPALLSNEGLAWIRQLFVSRTYKIDLPEDAALFVVAWLHEQGRVEEAISIIDEISDYAAKFHFTPKKATKSLLITESVHRFSSNDIRKRLLTYEKNHKIETSKEAHQIWIPFTDKLVFHWLELLGDNFTDSNEQYTPSKNWKDVALQITQDYKNLKQKHRLCRKYHNKGKNLQILLSATYAFLTDTSNQSALKRAKHVVSRYVKAHGKPGEDRFEQLRKEQARIASLPTHDLIAYAVAKRLPASDDGLSDVESLLTPISVAGHENFPIPENICRLVYNALAAPIPELIKRGIIPSAEVMAELTPQLTALEISQGCTDEDVGVLVAESYKAFSRRRSLLLLDLSSQARFDELPWIKPIINKQLTSKCYVKTALRLAAYSIDYFPGVILPNPLIEQINILYWFLDNQRPFLAELAADIFTGRFVRKFDYATLTAASLLRDTLYERYYGLNYKNFETRFLKESLNLEKNSSTLIELMIKEEINIDLSPYQYFVVQNGMVIERAQIYTTHNLAMLIAENIELEHSYEELASKAFSHSLRLIIQSKRAKKAGNNYLGAIKNAAYAWRQALFFLSLSPEETIEKTICHVEEKFLRSIDKDISNELFNRLKVSIHMECSHEIARPFLGWTVGKHWIVDDYL